MRKGEPQGIERTESAFGKTTKIFLFLLLCISVEKKERLGVKTTTSAWASDNYYRYNSCSEAVAFELLDQHHFIVPGIKIN